MYGISNTVFMVSIIQNRNLKPRIKCTFICWPANSNNDELNNSTTSTEDSKPDSCFGNCFYYLKLSGNNTAHIYKYPEDKIEVPQFEIKPFFYPRDDVSLFFEASINETLRESRLFVKLDATDPDRKYYEHDKFYFFIKHDGNIGWDYYLYPGSGLSDLRTIHKVFNT